MVFAHCSQKKFCILSHRTSNNNNYCWHAIADSNQRIRIREKTLETLNSVIYTVSLQWNNTTTSDDLFTHGFILFQK